MSKVIILGANGRLARWTIEMLLVTTAVQLTLFLRNSERLTKLASDRVRVVEGDVLDSKRLTEAIASHDIVYANLFGDLETMAKNIVNAMNDTNIKRLIFISIMGIYNEVPGEILRAKFEPFQKSAEIIEASNLAYTLIRPAWFNSYDEINYQITSKEEPFTGKSVSRKSVAHFICNLIMNPVIENRSSPGIAQPY